MRRLLARVRRQQPLRTLRKGILSAFPWEVGYLRFVWFKRRKGLSVYGQSHEATKERDYSRSFFASYSPDRRVQWTMNLLAAIPDCRRDSLLVIGPRYEPEILMAIGLGWDRDGVRGLDTFSYSPYVDVGDMHDLPYADGSFSGVICGWTLSYSQEPALAAKEMQRVLGSGGYLVVSMQKVGPEYTEVLPGVLKGADRIQTLAQLDELFSDLDRVAGFEPVVAPGGEGHTIAAYRRPD